MGRAQSEGELSHRQLKQAEGERNRCCSSDPKHAETPEEAELGFLTRRNSDQWGRVK